MRILKNNGKFVLILFPLQFAVGCYIAFLRLDPRFLEAHSFDTLFFGAWEGFGVDIASSDFDIQIIFSLISLIIAIPLLSGVMSRQYLTKSCYCATRFGNYIKFYFGEAFKALILCASSGLAYALGIGAYSFFASDKTLSGGSFFGLFAQSLLAYAIVLFPMVIIATVISLLSNEKVGMIVGTVIFAASAALIFLLPTGIRQWIPAIWYFVNAISNEKEVFAQSPYVYLAVGIAFDALICIIACVILKKKDVLREEA